MRTLFTVLFIASVATACTDPSTEVPAATVAEGEAAAEAAAPEGEAATQPAAEEAAAEEPAAEEAAPAIQELAFSNEGSAIGFTGSKVTGSHDGGFNGFTGTVQFNPAAPESSTVSVTIDMATIFADDERLTGHLQTDDFFDVANHATGTFTSTSVAPLEGEGGTHTITGDLTLRGVTKTISFPATVDVTDTAFKTTAEFSINRMDFGISYAGREDDLIREGVVIRLDINAPRG